jgi:pimeloyl-ACP methyl ester carboxylesterase
MRLRNSILLLAAVAAFVVLLDAHAFAQESQWEFKSVSVIENNPGLYHYVWEMARPPYGPWDKIALHRRVYQGSDVFRWPNKRRAIFIIPGTWEKGAPKAADENVSTDVFLANHGYDVYTMDFRTVYVDNLAYDQFTEQGLAAELAATGDWTYGAFREDIKACVDMAKKLTNAKKIFLAGRSRGGTQMYIYASKYWQEDLKGLIGLDGGGVFANIPKPEQQMTEAQYLMAVAAFKAGLLPPPMDKLMREIDGFEQSVYAGAVPYSPNAVGMIDLDSDLVYGPPPDGSTIETVSDLVAYGAFYAWGPGVVTNYYTPYPGGAGETYMNREVLIGIMANFTRYWPSIQDLEGSQLGVFLDCPFLDYDDHVAEINIPILFFGGVLGCPGGSCLAAPPNKTASTDVTVVYLPAYGHLDVYAGTHSRQDVKEPLLEWLNARQ